MSNAQQKPPEWAIEAAREVMQGVNLHAFSDVTYDQLQSRIAQALAAVPAGTEREAEAQSTERCAGCNHLKSRHRVCEDHDECMDCVGDDPCCNFSRPAHSSDCPNNKVIGHSDLPCSAGCPNRDARPVSEAAKRVTEKINAHYVSVAGFEILTEGTNKVAAIVESELAKG